ncbi:hypothetical protein C6366_11520 [Desulfonatronum sp. SC1]|nr:hypothetical protein C6366_11520 [Desulfonatronum sp. SC1]
MNDFRGPLCRQCPAGFTLMETLVAVIITSLTVTVFFQLLSGSMNLERKGRDLVQELILADRAFEELQRLDVRDPDFPWEGEAHGLTWRLEIHPVDIASPTIEEDELALRLPQELYLYVFHYGRKGDPGRTIQRHIAHAPDFFDDRFRSVHISASPPADGA